MKNKLVSIIIVNFNGKAYADKCISSILKNSYKTYEIILADNNSTDGSAEFLSGKFGHLNFFHLIKLDKNYGPAYARNAGVKQAQGEIIGFLDNDTEVDPFWIDAAAGHFEKDPKIGAIQCKLLLNKNRKRLDYAGEYLGSLGFLVNVAAYQEEDKGQFDYSYEILAAKSAGMFISKEAFEKAGGFDEDYFIFVEETDLGWRVRLAGYKIIFAYDSRVYHEFSTTKSIADKSFNNFLVRFHGTKNYIMTLYKNLSFWNMIIILPRHIFIWFSLSFYLFLCGNFDSSSNILRGIGWNMKNIKRNYIKRKKIQAARIISDEELFKKVYRKKTLLHYIRKFFKSQKQMITAENKK